MSRSGFLNLVKPPGMTSHDVVSLVRKRTPRRTKVGHLGTLDPPAAGVLPLAVGRATKLIPLLPDLGGAMKAYLAYLRLGITTTTDDLEGEVVSRTPVEGISRERLEEALEPFRGRILQVPPQVSAVRQDGKRAYQRVRAGETVRLEPRPAEISELTLLEYQHQSATLKIYMECGSGTYVRSVARDLGRSLGTGGALAFLLRTHSGPFLLEQSVSLEELMADGVETHLLGCDFPFSGLPVFRGDAVRQKGQKVRGEFPEGSLLRAEGGLVSPSNCEPGTAVVEAVFEVDR